MADGFFRSKKGFTVVQNVITRDKQISLKAKGLYLVIQSYITLPDKKWMKSEFMNMVSEGKSAFDNAWNELKNYGYLHVHIFSDGRNFTYEYELLNEPADGPHTFYYNSKGELTSTNESRSAKKNNSKTVELVEDINEEAQKNRDDSRYTGFRYIGNQDNGNQYNGNQYNGNQYNGNQYNGNRSNGDRDDGNRGNNINPFINPNNKTDNNTLSFIPGTNERTNESSIVEQSPILVDPDMVMVDGDISDVMFELEDNYGIPIEMAFEPELMKKTIMVLMDWNSREDNGIKSTLEKMVYAQIVECMTEMATALTPVSYKGAKISYKNMIDMLNRYCSKEHGYQGSLSLLADEVKNRTLYALRNNNVKDSKKYIKSIIWEQLNTHQMNLRATLL